MEFQVVES